MNDLEKLRDALKGKQDKSPIMHQPPTGICPLLVIANRNPVSGPAVCIGERCAWWDYAGNDCTVVAIVEALREATP